jgi:hypothetical protein
MRIIPIQNERRLLILIRDTLSPMGDESRDRDIFDSTQLDLLTFHEPISRARLHVECLLLQQMLMRHRCHEAGFAIAPFVVNSSDSHSAYMDRLIEFVVLIGCKQTGV